jgi:ribosomal protein S18 acetylase RimI-like enzyme
MDMETLTIEDAGIADAAEILALQKLAYQSEAELYGDDAIPPLTQTLAGLETEFADARVLKATADGRIVGSVRGRVVDGVCHVGRLMVHPDLQGRGIGSRLLRRLEALFPAGSRFELFTGHRSAGNLRLYERLGYRETRRSAAHPGLTLVFLDKGDRPIA